MLGPDMVAKFLCGLKFASASAVRTLADVAAELVMFAMPVAMNKSAAALVRSFDVSPYVKSVAPAHVSVKVLDSSFRVEIAQVATVSHG